MALPAGKYGVTKRMLQFIRGIPNKADATVQTASVVILDAYMNRVENYHQDVSKK